MKRLLPYLFAFASCNAVVAEVVDVPARYGTTYANGNKTVAQTWGTYAAFKAARGGWAGSLEFDGKALGMTQAEIEAAALKMYRGEVDIQSGLWDNEECIPCGQNYTNGNGQRNTIVFKLTGVFLFTAPLEPRYAKFDFGGTAAYGGAGWATGGTCLKIDHANWNTRIYPSRTIFPCNDWGKPANDGSGYAEGLEIHGVMLDGGMSHAAWDPSFESYGIAIRNSGSACSITNVVCNGFNTAGFAWGGGIPILCWNSRSFYNGKFGYSFLGTALSTGVLVGCETDDCGKAMFGFEPGYGQAGGGNLTIYSSKAENGKNGIEPMQLAYIRASAGAIQFVGFHAALYNGVVVPVAFDVQATNTTVTVGGLNECGSTGSFTKLLNTASKSYGMTNTGGNSCKPIGFATNGFTMTSSSVALAGSTQADKIADIIFALPIQGLDGGVCPPCPDPVICPPPVVCPVCPTCPPVVACPPAPTYLLGPWYKSGYCRSGLQTWRQQKVYFSGVNGKVTTITDSQPCSVTVHP